MLTTLKISSQNPNLFDPTWLIFHISNAYALALTILICPSVTCRNNFFCPLQSRRRMKNRTIETKAIRDKGRYSAKMIGRGERQDDFSFLWQKTAVWLADLSQALQKKYLINWLRGCSLMKSRKSVHFLKFKCRFKIAFMHCQKL